MLKNYKVSASMVVEAPAEMVYAIVADYREGHPQILPRKYFTALEVERGGRGEGTVIRFRMRLLGRERNFRAAITEPEPGRVLAETNLDDGGAVTSFVVDPYERGRHSRVTIITELRSAAGLYGLAERFLTTTLLRRIYTLELKLLAALAERRPASLTGGVPTHTRAS